MKLKFYFFPLFVALLLLGWSGCSVLDPAEEIPSYIGINDIGLTVLSGQGAATEKITDAWVYLDGELIGGFELPCKIPVLAEGTHQVVVRAGIKQNGLSSTRAIYPFYKGWESAVTLTRGQVTQVVPVVTYFPDANFEWLEDFEGAGISIDDVTGATFPGLLDRIGPPEALDDSSGFVQLNSTQNLFYCRSAVPFSFNLLNDIYLELDYKSDQPFSIGLFNVQNSTSIPWIQVEASNGWNKIYIRLYDALEGQPPNSTYHVYIAMAKSDNIAQPRLYLDNIKLLN